MKPPFLIAVAALVMSTGLSRPSGSLTGRASVADGDTIEMRGERVRLHGVDAPESWQTCEDSYGGIYRCGKESASTLDRFLAAVYPPYRTALIA